MAAHYGTAIVPTRVRKPRDKAKVEVAVQVVERWILARLRHQRFFSLTELNAALVEDLNARPMRKLGVSRRQLFEQLDQPALSSLPSEPFVYAEWRIRRVALDYHVDIVLLDSFPDPASFPTAMDQHEGRHHPSLSRRLELLRRSASVACASAQWRNGARSASGQ